MSTAIIHFTGILQNMHNLQPRDPNAKFMESRVTFSIEVNKNIYPNMSAILRQPYGTDYSTEPIEAEKPEGDYPGNWNHNAFRDVAEDYYRRSLSRVVRGAAPFVMTRNYLAFSEGYKIEIPD